MARKDTNRSNPKTVGGRPVSWWDRLSEPLRCALRRTAWWTLGTLVLAGGIALGFQAVERQVLGHAGDANPVGIEVRCVVPAQWGPDPGARAPERLIRRIESALTPEKFGFYDAGLTDAVYALALANPWVRTVARVERLPVDGRGV
ncbi:MAG: hypothetical protein NT031_21010, partial [Planctomycetota bacterium]|nr:hypothetical protein [Planctomycetota bacterium]